MKKNALKGTILHTPSKDCFEIHEDAYLIWDGDTVLGIFDEIPTGEEVTVRDCKDRLIIPGMSDLHIHAPQYSFVGIAQNLEDMKWDSWFEKYCFPEESRLKDPEYAVRLYGRLAKDLLHTPTTRLCAYGTIHTDSTIILMQKLSEAGLAGYVGKVNMDRNSMPGLLETTEESISETERFLEETENRFPGIKPMITPRYVPSCTKRLLNALGDLSNRYKVPVQTHLSERSDEIEWVKQLEPDKDCYARCYEDAGLMQQGYLMAHCVYSDDYELGVLANHSGMIAHCPQGNMNSSGGCAPVRKFLDAGVGVGLGTDIAGGNTLNLFKMVFYAVLASKVRNSKALCCGSNEGILSLSEAFYLATKGGGKMWHTGSFEKGYKMDAVIVDDSRLRGEIKRSPYERLERIIGMSDDREICGKYVNGRELFYEEKPA